MLFDKARLADDTEFGEAGESSNWHGHYSMGRHNRDPCPVLAIQIWSCSRFSPPSSAFYAEGTTLATATTADPNGFQWRTSCRPWSAPAPAPGTAGFRPEVLCELKLLFWAEWNIDMSDVREPNPASHGKHDGQRVSLRDRGGSQTGTRY